MTPPSEPLPPEARALDHDGRPLVALSAQRAVGAVADSGPALPPRPLRPRGVGEMLDEGLELLREDLPRLVGIASLVWFPARLLVALVGVLDPATLIEGRWGEWMAGVGLSSLGSIFAQTLATAFVAVVVAARIQGDRPPLRRTILLVVRKLPLLLLLVFVVALSTGIAMTCLIVPGLILAWRLQLVAFVPVLEGAGFSDSFRRSWSLTRESFLRWFGLFALMSLLTSPVSIAQAAPYDPNVRRWLLEETGLSTLTVELIFVPLTTLFAGLAAAYTGAVFALYYVDQRVRREGLDLEVRFGELSRGASHRAPVADSRGGPA